MITAVRAWISAASSQSAYLALGSAQTGWFGLPVNSGLPTYEVGAGTGWWLVNGGTTTLYIYGNNSTPIHFNRGGGGSTDDAAGALGYSGTIGGSYDYYLPPTAPTSVNATPSTSTAGRITVSWGAPSDNGGLAVTSYNVYRGGTYIGNTTSLSYADSGLTAGTSYTYTVRARNPVTDQAGTESVNSSSATATAPGVPGAPTGLTATASTTVTGRISLSWTAPAITAGGITGYQVYQGGTLIASTTGTGTTYVVSGLTPYTTPSFTVAARNSFADANSTQSAQSSSASTTVPGPPSAPTAFTATADGGTAGKVNFSWTAPSQTGTGGITGYNIYLSDGTLQHQTTGTGTSTSLTGYTPGATYTFYITARNALADTEGSESSASNTSTVTTLGESPAPADFTVTASTGVPGRLVLSWTTTPGGITGYTILDKTSGTEVLVAKVSNSVSSYMIDNLPIGTARTYTIKTRNAYTDTFSDGYPGNWGGPSSDAKSATPSSNFTQDVGTLSAATDNTNAVFNGTYTITSASGTSITYLKTNANVALTTSAGTITNNTNTTFSGTYVITSIPTANKLTYAKTASNISNISGASGSLTDTTNQALSGTKTVTSVNTGAKTFTYDYSGVAIASVAVPLGTVTNTAGAIYNGSGFTISSIPSPTTLTYAKTNADLPETNAAGIVTDTTNRDEFNGEFTVAGVPSYDTFTFVTTGEADVSSRETSAPGDAYRASSPARIDIKYRSGWAG